MLGDFAERCCKSDGISGNFGCAGSGFRTEGRSGSKVFHCGAPSILPRRLQLVVALGAEQAVAGGLDSALVGAVAAADEAVPVVVVGAFALSVFAHLRWNI